MKAYWISAVGSQNAKKKKGVVWVRALIRGGGDPAAMNCVRGVVLALCG
jgi:hypothetical protein